MGCKLTGLVQRVPFRKLVQYFVVPKEALRDGEMKELITVSALEMLSRYLAQCH